MPQFGQDNKRMPTSTRSSSSSADIGHDEDQPPVAPDPIAADPSASDSAQVKADKDMPVILSLIPDLDKVEFHVWDRAVKHVAYRYNWPKFILDQNTDVPDVVALSPKEKCDITNATWPKFQESNPS